MDFQEACFKTVQQSLQLLQANPDLARQPSAYHAVCECALQCLAAARGAMGGTVIPRTQQQSREKCCECIKACQTFSGEYVEGLVVACQDVIDATA